MTSSPHSRFTTASPAAGHVRFPIGGRFGGALQSPGTAVAFNSSLGTYGRARANEGVGMPVHLSDPGVYIEEIPSGVRTITGVVTSITAFLHNLFVQGAVHGRTRREAYFVTCDKETTTQSDITLGIVITWSVLPRSSPPSSWSPGSGGWPVRYRPQERRDATIQRERAAP
mgnify:FL=1